MIINRTDACRSLSSTTCPACGKTKKRFETLCARDYYALPEPVRQRLYRKVGAGYESAIGDAMDTLNRKTFTMPPKASKGLFA